MKESRRRSREQERGLDWIRLMARRLSAEPYCRRQLLPAPSALSHVALHRRPDDVRVRFRRARFSPSIAPRIPAIIDRRRGLPWPLWYHQTLP
jgi:hypothetical protein